MQFCFAWISSKLPEQKEGLFLTQLDIISGWVGWQAQVGARPKQTETLKFSTQYQFKENCQFSHITLRILLITSAIALHVPEFVFDHLQLSKVISLFVNDNECMIK